MFDALTLSTFDCFYFDIHCANYKCNCYIILKFLAPWISYTDPLVCVSYNGNWGLAKLWNVDKYAEIGRAAADFCSGLIIFGFLLQIEIFVVQSFLYNTLKIIKSGILLEMSYISVKKKQCQVRSKFTFYRDDLTGLTPMHQICWRSWMWQNIDLKID